MLCPLSPPNALSAVVMGDSGLGVLTATFPFGPKETLTLDFRVRLDLHFATNSFQEIAAIAVGAAGSGVSIVLIPNPPAIVVVAKIASDAGVVASDAGTTTVGSTKQLPAPGEWKHLRLVITSTTVTAFEDDSITLFASGSTPFPFLPPATVTIGSFASGVTGEVDFDDVTFDVR